MANTILLTLNKLGYVQIEPNIFKKTAKFSYITLIFNKEEKYVHAVQIPVRVLEELKDITILYQEFKEMTKDIKTLSNLTGYSIINNIEEDE